MQINSPNPEGLDTATPTSSVERPWMVKIAVFILAGSIISGLLKICADLESATLPIAFFLFIYNGIQAYIAWGLWQMKDLARKGLIAIVVTNALGFVYEVTQAANYNAGLAFFAVIIGLVLRGAFVYWFLENERLFVE